MTEIDAQSSDMQTGEPGGRRTDAAFIAALFALAALAFAHVFARTGGEVLGSTAGDVFSFFQPMREYANAELRAGRLPLWNPHLFCGLPMHAEGQVGLFYPTFLATFFLPGAVALDLSAFLHFALCGAFLYLYLRRLGLSPFASFVGGFAYQFSAATTMRLYAGLVSMIPSMALTPALLFVWESWRRTGRRVWIVWGALAYGCLILAGHFQSVFYTSLYVCWHVAFGLGEEWRRGGMRPVFRSAIGFAALVALGVGVGGVQLVPTLDFVGRSSRAEATYEFCSSFSLLPENLLTFVAPGFFGDVLRTRYWGRDIFWEMDFYVGILPLALALATLLRPGSIRFLGHALAVPVFLVIALGRYTPVFGLLYRYVPLFDSFRGVSKLVFFTQVSLCALAAAGIDRMLRYGGGDPRARGMRLRTAGALVGMIVLGAVLLSVFGGAPGEQGSAWRALQDWRFEHTMSYESFDRSAMGAPAEAWRVAEYWIWRMAILAAVGLALMAGWWRLRGRNRWMRAAILAVLVPDLFLFSRSYLAMSPVSAADPLRTFAPTLLAEKKPFRLYVPTIPGNPTISRRMDNVRGHTGLFLGRVLDYFVSSGQYHRVVTPLTSRLPDAMSEQRLYPNVRYVVAPPELADGAPELELLGRTAELGLYRVRTELPRAYFAPPSRIVRVRSREDGIRAFTSPPGVEFPVTLATVVETPEDSAALPALGPLDSRDSIRLVRREAGRLELDTSASGARLLVVTDAYDKDWECRLDGSRKLAIFPVNLAFRGVAIPQGAHRVEFVYRPKTFYIGSLLSVLSLVALLVGLRVADG